MNLFIKQNHGHREQIARVRGCGKDAEGGWGQQMEGFLYKMGKQQGPTLQHKELYLTSYDKP